MASRDQAFDAAVETLAGLAPLRELALEVRTYPLRLLRLVYEQHKERGGPVPDHLLKLPTYLGETSLRALVEGGFLERSDDPQYALYAYAPTDVALALIQQVDGAVPTPTRPKGTARTRPSASQRDSS